jgi:hypothetical protein
MFKINGKKIQLVPGNIKDVIAYRFDTLPELLTDVPPEIADKGTYQMKSPLFYMDGQKMAIRLESKSEEPVKWNEVKDVGLDPSLLKKMYIIAAVEYLQQSLIELDARTRFHVALMELGIDLGEEIDERIWFDRETTIRQFKTLVAQHKDSVKKKIQTLSLWSTIQPRFEFGSFVLTKINHQTILPNLESFNEFMVFDSVKLNDFVVGCFYQGMVKFNPEFTHLIDVYLNQDKILSKKLKAADVIQIMITTNKVKYKLINVFVTDETITFVIETLINEPKLTNELKDLVKNIIADMGLSEAYKLRTDNDFYYGSYSATINTPIVILKDMITNDPNIYNISYINESALINTRKSNLNIFLKKKDEAGTDIGVTLFEKPTGTFVRLKKVRGGNDLQTRIDSYIETINKIIQYVTDNTAPVLSYYRQYIELEVNLEPVEAPASKKKDASLKAQVPELFVANYTRLCNKPPIIVDQQEESSEILKFPIYGEGEPNFYKCPSPEYKYPGLRANATLVNKATFPFVPCCYKRPQTYSKNVKFYYDRETYEQRVNTGEIGKSLKVLAPRRIGVLPPRVDKLLNYVLGTKFYRYGIRTSRSSCIEVLNLVTGQSLTDAEVREELVERAELCKSEFPTISTKEIKNKIRDHETYIDPKLFKNALEDFYQVSYVLFSKDQDDFSTYPTKFIKFVCTFNEQIFFMIEHEHEQHVELVIDEETSTLINKQTKSLQILYNHAHGPIQPLFELYKQRFEYKVFDARVKDLILDEQRVKQSIDAFTLYPWEMTKVDFAEEPTFKPLNQYIDSYGQTRLVEFKDGQISFVGQFDPLPCLRLPIKSLGHFIRRNNKLTQADIDYIHTTHKWCNLYSLSNPTSRGVGYPDRQSRSGRSDGRPISREVTTWHQSKLDPDNASQANPYTEYKTMKKLAEYILWGACYVYSSFYFDISVDEWIDNHTRVIPDFTYSRVEVKPIFDKSEFLVDDKFIFDSSEFQERIKYNLNLISQVNLKLFSSNIYHLFYKDLTNFKLEYPAELALTKEEYYQRTRESYGLTLLTTDSVPYIKIDTLYFIQELFGRYQSTLCLFLSSFAKMLEVANKLFWKIIPGQNLINIDVFNQNEIEQYSIGTTEPSIRAIAININNIWYYGLLLPKLV